MNARLRRPTKRTCERCGRGEKWDHRQEAWQIATEDEEKLTGDPHCIHEWDINGVFDPIDR